MKQWKKALISMLMVGMLTTGGASLALADEQGQTDGWQPAGHRGGMLVNSDWLTEEIADLPADQQAEILALKEQLAALEPQERQREKIELTEEQKSVLESYQSQIKALEEELTAIFAEAGVTLESPKRGERPEAPLKQDKETGQIPPEKPADAQEQSTLAGYTGGERKQPDGRHMAGFGGGLQVTEEELGELDSEAQAQAKSLQAECQALREALHTALGIECPAQQTLTAQEQAAREEKWAAQKELRQALQEALQAAGIEWPALSEREAKAQ